MSPDFPLRVIFDDGECLTLSSPEDLLEAFQSIDAGDRHDTVWIRDQQDRTVRLRMRSGIVEVFEIA